MSRRIQTLFLAPSLVAGGSERVAVTLANNLDRTRFNPVLALVGAHGELLQNVAPDVKIVDLGCSRTRYAAFKLPALVRREQPDLVFSLLGHLNLLLALLRPALPSRPIYVARESNTVSANLPHTPWPRLFGWLYRRCYPGFDAVVCQSKFMRDDLFENFDVPDDILQVIHNPVDTVRIKTLAAEPARVVRAPFILAVGSLTRQKGLDVLLQAFAALAQSDVQLYIAGQGLELQSLQAMAQSLGVAGRTGFLGFVRNPYALMARARLLALPSRYEGLPNVALEALACGTPVVAADSPGGVREIIQHGENGLLTTPEDPAAFAAAMQTALGQQWDRERLRQSAAPFAKEIIVKKYEALFTELCARK